MSDLIKLILANKLNSIKNLTYLLNSVPGNRLLINNADLHERNLTLLINKIANPVTEFFTQAEIDSIDQVAREFFSSDFCNKIFRRKDLSDKLQRLWGVLDGIYTNNLNVWLTV